MNYIVCGLYLNRTVILKNTSWIFLHLREDYPYFCISIFIEFTIFRCLLHFSGILLSKVERSMQIHIHHQWKPRRLYLAILLRDITWENHQFSHFRKFLISVLDRTRPVFFVAGVTRSWRTAALHGGLTDIFSIWRKTKEPNYDHHFLDVHKVISWVHSLVAFVVITFVVITSIIRK